MKARWFLALSRGAYHPARKKDKEQTGALTAMCGNSEKGANISSSFGALLMSKIQV